MADVRARGGARRSALAAVALSIATAGPALAAASCTYAEREPGLLGVDRPGSTPPSNEVSSPPRPPLPTPNPDLPVAGAQTWISADGLQIQVRIAVHAVRRVGGATVLDWSVTPIEGPNLRPGDPLPDELDLGLSRSHGDLPNLLLVDAPSRSVYRPLRSKREPYHCLCTPIAVSEASLRIGVTRLLQTAFPELPADRSVIDVSIATVPPFWRVPVQAAGQVPVAPAPTDLTGPAEIVDPAASTEMFRYGPGEQVFRLRVLRVLASTSFTALEWQIVSVTGGRGVEAASTPPFARRDASAQTDHNRIAASGPTLRVPGHQDPLRARTLANSADPGDLAECLCTDLRGWPAVLRRPDKVATVVTNYPTLPPGTRQVQVTFHGHPALTVPVSQAADAGRKVATATATVGRWRFVAASPVTGWDAGDWPTPVPEHDQLTSYDATVDRLLR